MTIYLCGQPEGSASHLIALLFGLASGGVCRAESVARPAGELLPHRFTLTRVATGGLLSVALSVGSPRPALRRAPCSTKSGLSSRADTPAVTRPTPMKQDTTIRCIDALKSVYFLVLVSGPFPPSPSVDPDAVQRLADDFCQAPEMIGRPISDLSKEYGVREGFVREFVEFLKMPEDESSPIRSAIQDSWKNFVEWMSSLADRWENFTKGEFRSILVSAVVTFLFILVFGLIRSEPVARVTELRLEVSLGRAQSALILGMLCLHLGIYYARTRTMLVLQGSALILVLTGIFLAPVIFSSRLEPLFGTGFPQFVIWTSSTVVVTMIYWALAAAAAVFGGSMRIRKHDLRLQNMDRQDLLNRLLSLRERLEQWDGNITPRRLLWSEKVGERFRKHPFLYSGLAAGILRLVTMPLSESVQIVTASSTGSYTAPSQMLLVVSGVIFTAVIAFLSGGIRTGIVLGIWARVVVLCVEMLPFPGFGFVRVQEFFLDGSWVRAILLAVGVGTISALAYRIEQHATHIRRYRSDDPAALAAEWVQIQWLLTPAKQNLCVVVVDVKGSTQMKEGRDPLVAEWSFREFQSFVSEICRRNAGSVHSTTGDGVVIAFPSPHHGVAAAQRIQRELDGFNHSVNRLPTPFRVRIGIHMGEVTGDLDEVMFTRVIDVAAHVEAVAPVGGIALTKEVADEMKDLRIAELRESVDGHPTYVLLDPTGS